MHRLVLAWPHGHSAGILGRRKMLAKSVCQIATETLFARRRTYRALSMFKPNGGRGPGMERCPCLWSLCLQCFPGKPGEGSGRQSVEVEMRSNGTVKADSWICVVGWRINYPRDEGSWHCIVPDWNMLDVCSFLVCVCYWKRRVRLEKSFSWRQALVYQICCIANQTGAIRGKDFIILDWTKIHKKSI